MAKEFDVVINLDKSGNSIAFKNEEIIHHREFGIVKDYINDRLERVANFENSDITHDLSDLDTITIYGSRGSGKTSFILSLAEGFKANKKIEILQKIDPTLIEEKGHILLTLISQIKKRVDAKLKDEVCDPRNYNFNRKKEWREQLEKLSAGLPTLEGVGKGYEGWQDPIHIMDVGLDSVNSAFDLCYEFHRLVRMALDILEKKMFLVMFDDIDIDFQKGWPVLETIRKYLTTPQITTIISGDMQLFSKAVKKRQWKNFGKALVINEGEYLDRMQEYNDIVLEMESQYMQKVLKPVYRNGLNTLAEKLSLGVKIGLKLHKENCGEYNLGIQRVYREIFKSFGVYDIYQSEPFVTYMLSLPIRLQVQFLKSFKINISDDDSIEINQKNDPSAVFLSYLYENEVNYDLAKNAAKFTVTTILDVLIRKQILHASYQLQPATVNTSINGCFVALSLLFNQQIKCNPYLIFEYFVKIGYFRNFARELKYQNSSREGSVYSIENFIKHIAIDHDRNSRDSMCYATTFVRSWLDKSTNKTNFVPYAGTICLFGTKERAKRSGLDDRIDAVFENESGITKQLAFLPLSRITYSKKQESTLICSIYTLLGAIAEAIKSYTSTKSIDQTTAVGSLKKRLELMSQLRDYPIPSGGYSQVDNTASDYEEVSESKEVDFGDELANNMEIWINKFNGISISPYLLGKISTRIYYTIETIDNSKKIIGLGDAMHRRIVAILNSILVEEVRDKIDISVNLNNPVTSDDIFVNNLKKIINKLDELPLFVWMLNNPMFASFLDRKISDEFDKMQGLKEKLTLDTKTISICDILNNVEVKYEATSTNKNTTKKVSTKPIFGYSLKRIKECREVFIRKGITYNNFMTLTITDLINWIRPLVSNPHYVKEDNIEAFRKTIINNPELQW